MFSKKKTVPVLPRSRFAKAKPNLKVLPKNSQQNEKEKKLDQSSSLNQKESEVSETVSPEIPDESVNSNDIEKSTSLNQNKSEVSEIVTPEVSEETFRSNEIEKCSTEEETITVVGKDISLGNVEKEISSQCSAPIDNPEVSPTVFSPVKTFGETSNSLPLEHPNEMTESPEKFANCSPTKTSTVCSIDKSNKYPCITKLLAAPKKRSKNIEIRERKKMMASYKDLPPRSEMTFTDLIFWNPHTSPMKSKEKKSSLVFNPTEKETTPAEEEAEDEEEEGSVAPKLFVNEDGEIILDESSLVVKRKKTNVDMTSEAIIMDDSNVTYSSFRKRAKRMWTPTETVKFYKALSVVGTDFALMENIMPNRTRRELKIKFKKEEKINMELLQRAMYETETFQTNLTVDDLNLDVIDIPGLEERIAKDITGSICKKQGRRKKNAENLSDNNINENDPDFVAKRSRGRPKKVSEPLSESDSKGPNCANNTSLIIKRGRGRPRKAINSSSIHSPGTETSNDATEGTFKEADDLSPLIRKRNVKVLSQDSLESNENATDDLVEIEVQIESSNSNKTQDQNIDVSTLSENSTAICDKSMVLEKENISSEPQINPEESPTVCDDEATSRMSRENISEEQKITPESSTTDVTEQYLEKRIQSQKIKKSTSEQPYANRKSKRVKISPNLNTHTNESISTKNTLEISQNGSIHFPTSPSSIIEVTDEQLLSDSVTDVVTSSYTKVPKKSKSSNPTNKNGQNTLQRLQLSSRNYTPVDEVSTENDPIKKERMFFNSIQVVDEPVFFKNPNQRKYGCSETKDNLPRTNTTLPLPSSPLVDNLMNLKSSLVTSFNMSSKDPITISVTPEQNVSENSEGVMLMAQSPEGNRLHFYVANNFTGGLALPSEISIPPENIVIKSEEENFDLNR